MSTERQVRLFRNGRNQAVRIPRDLELPGRAAMLRKEGSRLIVEPLAGPSLLAVLATLEPLDVDLPRFHARLPSRYSSDVPHGRPATRRLWLDRPVGLEAAVQRQGEVLVEEDLQDA